MGELERSSKRSCTVVAFVHDETYTSQWCRFEWKIARENSIPVKSIVDTDSCLKRTVIERLHATEPFLLAYQMIEYSPMYLGANLTMDGMVPDSAACLAIQVCPRNRVSLLALPSEAVNLLSRLHFPRSQTCRFTV